MRQWLKKELCRFAKLEGEIFTKYYWESLKEHCEREQKKVKNPDWIEYYRNLAIICERKIFKRREAFMKGA